MKKDLEQAKYNPANFLVLFITLVFTILALIIVAALNEVFKNVDASSLIAEHGVGRWGAAILGSASIFLYKFKSSQQFWYGIVEASFGYFSIVKVVGRLEETVMDQGIDSFSIIGGLSAAYLIVRGFTNVAEGYIKPFRWKHIVEKYSK